VVPNLATWIGRGRVTKAISEIKSIELALSAMLADTERSSLSDLFDPAGVDIYLDGVDPNPSTARFKAAEEMYTRTTYALLRDGRGALAATDTQVPRLSYKTVLRQGLVSKMGTNYLPEIAFDPWGKLYNVFPGPWDPKNGPIIFRIHQKDTSGGALPGKSGNALSYDVLTYGEKDAQGNPINSTESFTDPETGLLVDGGYPANTRKAFYIWSNGANTISSQAIYQPSRDPSQPLTASNTQPYNGTQSELSYDSSLDLSQVGGGDDINNWDSGSTWQPDYN
jgi:hypothetical protein